jgi:hypothetical protein
LHEDQRVRNRCRSPPEVAHAIRDDHGGRHRRHHFVSSGGVMPIEDIDPFAGHSVQGHPLAIEEVRRILLEHAAAVCASSGIACGPDLRGGDRDRGMPPAGPVDEPPALYQR